MEWPHPQTGRCRPAPCRQTRYHMFTHAPRRLWANSPLALALHDKSIVSRYLLTQHDYRAKSTVLQPPDKPAPFSPRCHQKTNLTCLRRWEITNSRQWRDELIQYYELQVQYWWNRIGFGMIPVESSQWQERTYTAEPLHTTHSAGGIAGKRFNKDLIYFSVSIYASPIKWKLKLNGHSLANFCKITCNF